MNKDIKEFSESSSKTAEDFTRLYYGTIDKRRHQIGRLYLDNATFVWNGNGVRGQDNIQDYLLKLPSTEHQIQSLVAHPVMLEPESPLTTMLVQSNGFVRFNEKPMKPFFQSFTITIDDNKWKIVTDNYRLQEPFDK